MLIINKNVGHQFPGKFASKNSETMGGGDFFQNFIHLDHVIEIASNILITEVLITWNIITHYPQEVDLATFCTT